MLAGASLLSLGSKILLALCPWTPEQETQILRLILSGAILKLPSHGPQFFTFLIVLYEHLTQKPLLWS